MRTIPKILEKCVKELQKKGKSEKSAYAICTSSMKKAGKMEDILESIADSKGDKDRLFQELKTYIQNDAMEAWHDPEIRESLPSSYFFDADNRRLPFRDESGTVIPTSVDAALEIAQELSDDNLLSEIKGYKEKLTQTQTKNTFHRFLSAVPFQLSDKSKNKITIQVMKMGKFRHPWYGTLNFDENFFNSIIRNFERDIPNPEIAFDFKHQPDYGAAAWVNGLSVDGTALMAAIELTKRGRQSIEDKEFRYFSIEYTEDYAEYSFKEDIDEKGNAVEKEIKVSYGPTVLGGGLTNRPFLKGMRPVGLSEDGNFVELEEIKNEEHFDEEVTEDMKKKLEELERAQDEIKAQMKELSEAKDDESKQKYSDLETQLGELSDQIKELSDKKPSNKDKNDDDPAIRDLQDANASLLEELKSEKEAAAKLSEDVRTLSDTVTKLMESNKVLHEDRHKLSVEKEIDEFKKLGVFPATLKVIEGIAFTEPVKQFNITLSEEEGKEEKIDFFGFMRKVFESVPEDHRFSLEERSESPTTPTGNSKELSIEDVEKYAKEKGIEFQEALVELSKEGKI